MKRFLTLVAASLLGLGLVAGSVAAQGTRPSTRLGKAYRPGPRHSAAAVQNKSGQAKLSSPAKAVQNSSSSSSSPGKRHVGFGAGSRVGGKAIPSATRLSGIPTFDPRAANGGRNSLPNLAGRTDRAKSLNSRPSAAVPNRIKMLSPMAGAAKKPAAIGKRPLAAKAAHVLPSGADGAKKLAAGSSKSRVLSTGSASVAKVLERNKLDLGAAGAGRVRPAAAAVQLQPAQPAAGAPSGQDARPCALITTDEDGNEHWEGTLDEELAINAGGTYEWTDAEGGRHVTEVTPEGTRRTYESEDGGVASQGFTPHERREEAAGTGNSDVDRVLSIVGGVLAGVAPYVPAPGGGVDYYDPGYVVPGYVVPIDPGYGAAVPSVELIPGASADGGSPAGTSDAGLARFTRRLLHVKNNTDEPITVWVQFRSQIEGGQWAWLPADPASSQDALAFELAAGQEGYLEHEGVPISASRVRIWGESATCQWRSYLGDDLWLVSEVDASGERAYFAAEMESYPFTFE